MTQLTKTVTLKNIKNIQNDRLGVYLVHKYTSIKVYKKYTRIKNKPAMSDAISWSFRRAARTATCRKYVW